MEKKYDEFSNSINIKEGSSFEEAKVVKESQINPEAKLAPEATQISEESNQQVAQKPREAKKNNALAALSGSLIGIISAVTFGLTTMLNVTMSAEFDEVTYDAGVISYSINVENLTEKETLTLYFKDGVTGEITPYDLTTADEDGDGVIQGTITIDALTANDICAQDPNASVKYELSLKGVVGLNVERAFDNYVVKFSTMSSEFRTVSGECHCGVDGCYHFTMDFQDDLGIFSDFKAYIVDYEGNSSYCTFTENLHDEQKIFVGDLKGSKCTFNLEYKNSTLENLQSVTMDINL